MNRRDFCSTLAAALGVALVKPESLIIPGVKPVVCRIQNAFLIQDISFLNTGEIGSKFLKLDISTDDVEHLGLQLPLSASPHFHPYAPIWLPGNTEVSLLGDPGARIAIHGVEVTPNGQLSDIFHKTYWWSL